MIATEATSLAIGAAAVRMIGTPFEHRGRVPGVRLDCAGLVLCAHWAAGVELPDCIGYGPLPRRSVLLRELEARATQLHRDDAGPGDIVLFEGRPNYPMHFGILLGQESFVHAHQAAGGVVQTRLTKAWASRLHSFWCAVPTPDVGEVS